ncbi:MAG: hypothetical protein E7277_08675 [Lachnospiraceae bacterium]|jgi:hypothetical protein|nr:hypothetical protein [Lachnospiraceae bacterium]
MLFKCLGIIVLLVGLMIVELNRFRVTDYTIHSGKLKNKCVVLFLTDLHGKTFRGRLLNKITTLKPDYILIGGDVITKKKPKELSPMADFVIALQKIAPVYYGFGNHETTIDSILGVADMEYGKAFSEYLKKITEAGVTILRNETVNLREDLALSVLELPVPYYKKMKHITLSKEEMMGFIKMPQANGFKILMAHHPVFADTYRHLNINLMLCGHTHGGLIRFPFIGSIISTELLWFPKYDGGIYEIQNENEKLPLVVSKGLGYHSYPIRILNRAEAVRVYLEP